MRALQQLFAPMTHIDMEKAKSELTALQMYRGKLVTSFIQRFHTKLSAVQAMGFGAQHGLTQFKLALLFVQKLEKRVVNTDQRVLVLGYKSLLQKCTDVANPPVSFTAMQSELTELEFIVYKSCGVCCRSTHFAHSRFQFSEF